MFGQLVPCGGGDAIPLLSQRVVVGRIKECDVTLPFGTVSSRHCLLEMRGGMWFVTDLASRNGVRINNVRCQDGPVSPGSILSLAQHRFQLDYAAAGETIPSRPPQNPQLPLRERDTTMVETARQARPAVAGPARAPASRHDSSLGELVPCGGGEPIPLPKPRLIVGRSPACDITLPFPMVSSKHCQLEFKEGFWHVRDLGSRNGIRVDGVFQLAKYLKPGEILWIAKHRFEIAYTPLSDEPPPEENPFALGLLEKAGLAGREAGGAAPRLPSVPDENPDRKRWSIEEQD